MNEKTVADLTQVILPRITTVEETQFAVGIDTLVDAFSVMLEQCRKTPLAKEAYGAEFIESCKISFLVFVFLFLYLCLC